MFCTSISKLHTLWYLSLAFQSNVGCLSTGLPDFCVVRIGLAMLTSIIAALVASIAACIISSVMLCSAAIRSLLKTALCEPTCFVVSSLPYVRLLSFSF